MLRLLFLLLPLALAPADGPGDGRKGNELYREQRYQEAALAYRAGLDPSGAQTGPARFGLLHNLGAALFRMEDFAGAEEAFSQALASARTPDGFANAAYNAGNTAYAAESLDKALDYYQRALLANPNDENAKFNYEFVKRRQQEQQQQQQQQQNQNQQNQEQQEQDQQQDGESEQDEQEQQQNQQGQEEEEQEQPGQEGDEQQEGQQQDERATSSQPDPDQLSREQAERILEAIQQDEEELLREAQRMKGRPQRVEKDW